MAILLFLAACSGQQMPSLKLFKETAKERQLTVSESKKLDELGFYGTETDAVSKEKWKIEYYDMTPVDAQIWFDASQQLIEENKGDDAKIDSDKRKLSDGKEFGYCSMVSGGKYYFVARYEGAVLRVPETDAKNQKEIEELLQKLGFK